jgi:hypothetical protein
VHAGILLQFRFVQTLRVTTEAVSVADNHVKCEQRPSRGDVGVSWATRGRRITLLIQRSRLMPSKALQRRNVMQAN